MLGQIFSFGFHTYLLSCIIFPFALRYFVNYAPWLRAVCKFGYSFVISRLCQFYQCNSVLAVDLFSVSLTTNPCCPQHLEFTFLFETLIVKHLLRHRVRVVFPRVGPC